MLPSFSNRFPSSLTFLLFLTLFPAKKIAAKLLALDMKDPFRASKTEGLLETLFNMGVIPTKKNLGLVDKVTVREEKKEKKQEEERVYVIYTARLPAVFEHISACFLRFPPQLF